MIKVRYVFEADGALTAYAVNVLRVPCIGEVVAFELDEGAWWGGRVDAVAHFHGEGWAVPVVELMCSSLDVDPAPSWDLGAIEVGLPE